MRNFSKPAAVIFVALTAACGSPSPGTPTADPQAQADAALFDPCTIPDDALTAAGLDPSTENRDIGAGMIVTGWKICDWDGPTPTPWFNLAVFSTSYTTNDLRAREDYQDFRDVVVNERRGIQFRSVRSDPSLGCKVAFDVEQGLIMATLDTLGSEDREGDTCNALQQRVSLLEPYLPSS